MLRVWALLALFWSGILFSGAHKCPISHQCVPKENCRREEPIFDLTSTIDCSDLEVCCEKSNIGKKLRPPTLPPGSLCGMSNPNGLDENQQVDGNEARPGQFPWVMALLNKGQYFGGGSLITPGLVLTAAHILLYKSTVYIKVRAGEWDLSSSGEVLPPEERQVTKIITHEAFNFSSGANNLALLFLDSPFEIKSHIQTICLPIPGKNFEGRRCMVAGWGKRSFDGTELLSIQQNIELPILYGLRCQHQLRQTSMGSNYTLPDSLICAGGQQGKDVCSRFGGSALFCALEGDPNRYEQAGIVNWGIKCGRENVPALYTHVSKFKEWIDPHLEQVFSVPGDQVFFMSSHL
ncbi:phenoloxidase-activating factor 2-like isoform X2 [Drosophila subpulchrella]|uniref:phenoloxidase-activating factor 2-like isoform X2 n=1 Tax=Drosophila subpulchrella TaxID=1486046 RepID=UPI0018A15557|nr:phenoloxidase-activating factor 2-like isoform X2 [Drosophila subpulchrella]